MPIGAYTRQVLGYLGITSSVMPQVVSQEKDVKAIAAKVALGTADAGFMYVTDARTVSTQVKLIPVPAWAQPPVRYQIAIVKTTANHADAAAFIKRLTSTAGRKLLVDNGFGVPKLPKLKKAKKKLRARAPHPGAADAKMRAWPPTSPPSSASPRSCSSRPAPTPRSSRRTR